MSAKESEIPENSPQFAQTDLEGRLFVLRQIFEEQQTDLLLQYQQEYAQLSLQHAHDSQLIVQDFLHLQETQQTFDGAGPSDRQISSDLRSDQQFISGRTISSQTKEKLKEMIHNKHKNHRLCDQSLVAVSPYPRLHAPVSVENELRKATSEPNLKMRGVQALRAKLIQRQQIAALRQNAARGFASAAPSSEAEPAPLGDLTSLFFATPSLPNVLNQSLLQSLDFLSNGQLTLTSSAAHVLSMPSLPAVPSAWPFDAVQSTSALLASALNHQRFRLNESQPTSVTSFSAQSHSNALHAQIRDLALRRKSLVREETEDDVKRESSTHGNLATCDPSELSPGLKRTGLAYDSTMCRHQCTCGQNGKHVEHGGRVQSIWARLQETGLTEQCERVSTRRASLECLRLCHSANYCNFFGISPTACLKIDAAELPLKSFVQLPCGGIGVDSDTYFNDTFTPSAARAAVGCAVDLCVAVAEGVLKNGFAVVRPPGHHAEPTQALGFCYFNNVAIATKIVRQKLGVSSKVAIIDWDVHHGNGTQLIFESDPHVLYLSLHRHDDGNFFPGTGAVDEIGKGVGQGFTVNVPWSGEPMGDAEYLAAWRCILQPILDDFAPDFIAVSCGFDAADGHWQAVGGYHLSSGMYGWMTEQLCEYANGRLALVLEGGYNLAAISSAAEACVRALVAADGSKEGGRVAAALPSASCDVRPNASCCSTLARVAAIQRRFWPRVSADPSLVSHSQWLKRRPLRRRFADLSVATSSVELLNPSTSSLPSSNDFSQTLVIKTSPLSSDSESAT